jgi:chromosome segregation ATPase
MNRSLKYNKENIEQISMFEGLIQQLRAVDMDQQDRDEIFNLERQVASLKASQESLNKDYRELQTKKSAMLKDMKATREQRVKRLEDSKQSFTGWLAYLVSNPDVARGYGTEMEKMRLAMDKQKERLSQYHKYQDDLVDQPFLTPDTAKE